MKIYTLTVPTFFLIFLFKSIVYSSEQINDSYKSIFGTPIEALIPGTFRQNADHVYCSQTKKLICVKGLSIVDNFSDISEVTPDFKTTHSPTTILSKINQVKNGLNTVLINIIKDNKGRNFVASPALRLRYW